MKLKPRLPGFSDTELVEDPAAEQRARAELSRQQAIRVAMTSGLPEIARSDLQPAHLGLLEHSESGAFFRVSQGTHDDVNFLAADAFYMTHDGPVFLEQPASGPKTRAELEQQQARRLERNSQPKPRPEWQR
jgi:hypothetical protein